MICCLLALLAALPGLSLVRRVPAGACAHARRRYAAAAVTFFGGLMALSVSALAVHSMTHRANVPSFGVICSALGKVTAR